jgi:hypothetical protein
MTVYISDLHDIIYRALFNMDRRALLIHLKLPANTWEDDNDDELLDNVGTLALKAISEIHTVHRMWIQAQPPNSVSIEEIKSTLRIHAGMIAKKYKARATELGEDLLTTMKW